MTGAHYKEIGLAAMSLALCALLALGFMVTLHDSFTDRLMLGAVIFSAVLWVVVTALTLALAQRWPWLTLLTLALGALLIVSGVGGVSWGAFGGGLLLAIFIMAGRQAYRRDMDRARTPRPVAIFNGGTRLLVTGLMVAAAGMALPFLEGKIAQEGIGISPAQIDFALRPVEPALRQQGIDLAAKLPTGESVTQVVTTRLNTIIQDMTQGNALIVALIAVAFAFLAFRALIPVITWGLLLFIAGGLWIARRLGLINTMTQTVEVEKLTL